MKMFPLLLCLACAAPATAFPALIFGDEYWAKIGDAGNAAHVGAPTYGAVAYEYSIAKTELTNAQYVDFLNAVAATDPYGLYHASMGSTLRGGIVRSGSSGSYTYSVKMGTYNYSERPVNYVSVYDSMRYVNWLNNGANGAANTESGAYTLLGGTATPSNALTITRTEGALYYVPTLDEWYKSAYYKGGGTDAGYWLYATGSDTLPTASAPSATANTANYNSATGNPDVMPVGSYPTSASAYGTFDQNGNVWEWTDFHSGLNYGQFGGGWGSSSVTLPATRAVSLGDPGSYEDASLGFRIIAMVPEPSTYALLTAGLGALLLFRRRCVAS